LGFGVGSGVVRFVFGIGEFAVGCFEVFFFVWRVFWAVEKVGGSLEGRVVLSTVDRSSLTECSHTYIQQAGHCIAVITRYMYLSV
jgi:hypothetical protein